MLKCDKASRQAILEKSGQLASDSSLKLANDL